MPPSIPLDIIGNANNCTKSTSNGIDGGTGDNLLLGKIVWLMNFVFNGMALLLSVFTSLCQEYFPKCLVTLEGYKLVINNSLPLEDCKSSRQSIQTIIESHSTIEFPSFERDLISSYLSYLKLKKIPAAIFF